MLDAARLVRYYDRLFKRHQWWCNAFRITLLSAAVLSASVLFDLFGGWLRVVFGLAVAVVVVVDFVLDYHKRAAVLHAIRSDLGALDVEFAALWMAIGTRAIENDEAQASLADLLRRMHGATDRAGAAGLSTNERLNEECQQAAFDVVASQYGQG